MKAACRSKILNRKNSKAGEKIFVVLFYFIFFQLQLTFNYYFVLVSGVKSVSISEK